MGYVIFNRILVTKLDEIALLKTTQTFGIQMKTFEIRRPK